MTEAGIETASAEVQLGVPMGAPEKSSEGLIAVVMFGSPGSGKGTQSKLLEEWLGIPQISTGDMLRDHIRKGDAIGVAITDRMKAGSLVSDELVNQLVFERLHQADARRGFILDGYPRTTAQAEEMLRLLKTVGADEVVIHLVVDYNVIISRMAGRRVCPVCGTLYNAVSRPPKIEGLCDLDGARLALRDDDREEVVRERLTQYERQTRPLIEFFARQSTRFFAVDGSAADGKQEKPEVVFGRIQTKVTELEPEVVRYAEGRRTTGALLVSGSAYGDAR